MEKSRASKDSSEKARISSSDSRTILFGQQKTLCQRESPSPYARAATVSPARPFVSNAVLSPKKRTEKEGLQKIVEKVKKGKKDKKKKKDKQKQKQKEKEEYLDLKDLRPLNLVEEKQTFWDTDFTYNPLFVYSVMLPKSEPTRPHQKYLGIAVRILQRSRAINLERRYVQSQVLSREQTSAQFDRYIGNHDIGSLVRYEFAEHTIAPTSVKHNNVDCISRVIIGLPIHYRRDTVRGVLNHEIGTHFFRKHNDRLQKWHKERKKNGMKPYLKHEEGLAALNQFIETAMREEQPPLLFPSALHYYSCFMACKMTFAQLFRDLQKYQTDPQLRWKECTRVKRGIVDTSTPGGMLKDQMYLRGAVSVLKHRDELDLTLLHCGKMSVKDCLRLQRGGIRLEGCKLPFFLQDLAQYRAALDRIARQNFIDQYLASRV